MTILQRSRLALAAAGLGLSFASPAFAADPYRAFTLQVQPGPQATLASLPPLPPPPRVFALTAERRAMLNTIRYSEGTWVNGHPAGYRMLFGGSYVPSLERHPDRVMYSSRYASAAAGAYQFMPPTWSMVSRALGLSDFQPDSQDQGALWLIQRRGALTLVDRGEFSPELAARLAPEWASFPTLAGASYYGQPVKRYEDLRRFYEQNLAELRQGGQTGQGNWQNVAIRPLPPVETAAAPEISEQVQPEAPEASPSRVGRLDPSGRF